MRRKLVALFLALGLAGALAAARPGDAAIWAVPVLDPEAARAIVAAGGAVELALLVPAGPADLGRWQALVRRSVDPSAEPEWQQGRQQALCPLGVDPLGETLDWVRVRVERSEVLERVLGSGVGLAPLAPPEIMVGEGWSNVPFAPGPWDPPAFSCAFAAGQREARWLYGDWDGDGAREVGKYLPALDAFLLDANGNGLWDGVAGGDASAWVAAAAGPGEPLVGDWDGDGAEGVGKAVGAAAWLDANESFAWEGRPGGDEVALVAPGRPDAAYVVGDWDGDGRDQLGRYEPTLLRFLLDADGNGRWDGAAAGDRRVEFVMGNVFPRTAFAPFVADFDGSPGDGVGVSAIGHVMADLDEDGVFRGAAGGDLDFRILFITLSQLPCFCGVELPPRPSDPTGSSGLYFPSAGFTIRTIETVSPGEPAD
jgi:hypothetical protein